MDYSKLSLKEKIFQTFIVDKHIIDLHGGAKNFFEKYPVGGMYYASSLVPDLGILMKDGAIVGRDFIKKCREFSKVPLLVCADSTEIKNESFYSVAALGASGDESLAYDYGKTAGYQSNYNDVDMLLGPCVDLRFSRTAEWNSQCMTDDPVLNARMYSQVIKGLQERGVAATVKHFPGQGSYHVNFHLGPGQNVLTKEEWDKTYGYCYKKMFSEDCMCVMTSHMTFSDYCKEGDNGFPPIATFSSKITVDLLKKELGFKGVVITDALTMGGMGCGNQILDAVQAFASGADLLLWPPMEACDIIAQKIQEGEIPMSRLDDALSRIQRLRDFTQKNKQQAPDDAYEFIKDVYSRMTESGVVLLGDKLNNLPIKKEEKILVIGNASDKEKMEKLKEFASALKQRGLNVDFKEYLLTCYLEEIREVTDPYDKVIFALNHLYEVSCTPQCASTTWSSHLVEKSKKIIVNFSSPYLADDYYPDEPTVINANQDITDDSVNAVIDRMLGLEEFIGTSPVKLNMRFAMGNYNYINQKG